MASKILILLPAKAVAWCSQQTSWQFQLRAKTGMPLPGETAAWCFQLPLPFLSSSMGSSSPICAAGGLLCPVLVEQQSGTATPPRSISEGIWIVLATAVSQRLPSLQAPAACAHWVQPEGKTSPHWGCRWIAVVLIACIKTRKMEGNTQASRHR